VVGCWVHSSKFSRQIIIDSVRKAVSRKNYYALSLPLGSGDWWPIFVLEDECSLQSYNSYSIIVGMPVVDTPWCIILALSSIFHKEPSHHQGFFLFEEKRFLKWWAFCVSGIDPLCCRLERSTFRLRALEEDLKNVEKRAQTVLPQKLVNNFHYIQIELNLWSTTESQISDNASLQKRVEGKGFFVVSEQRNKDGILYQKKFQLRFGGDAVNNSPSPFYSFAFLFYYFKKNVFLLQNFLFLWHF